jgi:hypothetical protein
MEGKENEAKAKLDDPTDIWSKASSVYGMKSYYRIFRGE